MSAPSSSGKTEGLEHRNQAVADAQGPALDYRAGLERLMGDQAMYLRVLTRFHLDYRDNAARLREALGAGDLPLAQRIAHTLNGAAAMIEARPLRRLAADVEQELRAGAGADPRLVEHLGRELARVMAQLDALLQCPAQAGTEAVTEPEEGLEEAPLDAPVSGSDMARLCEMLDTGDSAAQDFIEEQGGGLRTLLGAARMTELQAAMAAFDFEEALHVLRPGYGH